MRSLYTHLMTCIHRPKSWDAVYHCVGAQLLSHVTAAIVMFLLGVKRRGERHGLGSSDIRVSDAYLICKSVNAMHKVIDVVSMATM